MKFVSMTSLRRDSAGLRRDLEAEGQIIVTSRGRPIAVMTGVRPDSVQDEILAIRRERARIALTRMRTRAAAEGLDRLSMDEIDQLVAKARHAAHRPDPACGTTNWAGPHDAARPS